MRYPLAFGIMTALLATGMLLNMAATNRKHQRAVVKDQIQTALRKSFRFRQQVVPTFHLPPNPRGESTARLADAGCLGEVQYSQEMTVDRAQLYRNISWEKKRVNGSIVIVPVSLAQAREQVLHPAASSGRYHYQPQAKFECEVGFAPSADLLAGIQKAAAMRSGKTLSPATAVKQSLATLRQHPGFLPTDAIDSTSVPYDWHAHLPAAEATIDNDVWQLVRQFSLDLTDGQSAWQLVQNAFPSQPENGGCGISPAADSSDRLVGADRLEAAILDGVCQIEHVRPQQLAYDPFQHPVLPSTFVAKRRTGSGTKPSLDVTPLLTYVADSIRGYQLAWNHRVERAESEISFGYQQLAEWTIEARKSIPDVASQPLPPGSDSQWAIEQPITEWAYLTEIGLPTLESPLTAWEWPNVINQMRLTVPGLQDEAIPQPVPAANNLGIRHTFSKLSQWVVGQQHSVQRQVLITSRTLQNWGLQQNAALERMVLQHDDRMQR